MSVISLLLLIFIFYLCFKAIGSIWRDAFGTIDDGTGSRTNYRSRRRSNTTTTHQQSTDSQSDSDKPIRKGEGEYVDYEEV